MEAIEFKTKIKNGMIQIPRKYSRKLGDSVKVIILSDLPAKKNDIIDELLENPVKMDSFTPLAREDIYERDSH
jgi:hypothetical protein